MAGVVARAFGKAANPVLVGRQIGRDYAPRQRILLIKQFDLTVRGLKAGKVSSSASKRFGLQKSGRITRAQAYKVHKNTSKTRGHVNRLATKATVSNADAMTAMKLLGLK